MFELSVALKYLIPKWRQLSVSIISLISIVVIALVVWLIVVFFSVTYGLEKSWVQKLIALTAPVRVYPTPEYYNSYYYQIDGVSANSDYVHKSIEEKLSAEATDPYDPDFDEEVPMHWPPADRDQNGELKDIAKRAYRAIEQIPSAQATDYEMTIATLNLSENSHPMYLSTYDAHNQALVKSMLPVGPADIKNLLDKASADYVNQTVHIETLKTTDRGWRIPETFLPEQCAFESCAVKRDGKVVAVIIPTQANQAVAIRDHIGDEAFVAELQIDNGTRTLIDKSGNQTKLSRHTPLFLEKNQTFPVTMNSDLTFEPKLSLQGVQITHNLSHRDFEIDRFTLHPNDTSWLFIPSLSEEGVMLPKSFRESGILIGDRGTLTYHIPTASSMQEQRLPIYVAGFYDPGILPLGGKIVLANKEIVSIVRSSYPNDESHLTNGINIRFDDLDRAEQIKEDLITAFQKEGIDQYWRVETYREFEFTRDILQQLRSEKNLFTILAAVIIIVACSNIISMLIILVNDKRTEIGILRSMGATSRSIAAIFGFCGMVMGVIGSIVGILAAIVTLHNLQALIDFISRVQGFEMFNPVFYGDTLPNELSFRTLAFVLVATGFVSLLAGIVPAVKACMMRPSEILRSE